MSQIRLLELGAKAIPCLSLWAQRQLMRSAKENEKFTQEVLAEFSRVDGGEEYVRECGGRVSYDELVRILACCDEALLYRLSGREYKTWRSASGEPLFADVAGAQNTGGYVDSVEMILSVPSLRDTVLWYQKYLGWYGGDIEDNEKWGHAALVPFNTEAAGLQSNTFKGFHLRRCEPGMQTRGSCFVFVSGLDALREKITAAGWDRMTGISRNAWGTRSFNLTDCNGFILEICEWVCGEEAK